MDHDALDQRVRNIESFLDANARGWRDESQWRSGARRSGTDTKTSDLEVDEEKTKRDREALGFTDQTVIRDGRPYTPGAPTIGRSANPGVDDGRDAEIRENFRSGKGPVSNETAEQNERADLLAQLEPYRGQDGVPELTGEENNDELRSLLDRLPKPGNAANEVALEAARASPATEQALQTSQDPVRQARAEAQQDQKRAVDRGGVRPAPAITR